MGVSGALTLRRLCHEPWPITNLAETGNRIGVTRERVRQLVRKHRIPTLHMRERPSKYRCLFCGKHCKHPGHFCSRCWRWSRRVILTCDHCGAYFARRRCEVAGRRNQARYKGHHYCSFPCALKHIFDTSPNHLKALLRRL